MSADLQFQSLGAFLAPFSASFLTFVIIAALVLLILFQHRWQTTVRVRQVRRHLLGKRISEFGERLAANPLEQIDATIIEGLDSIIKLLDADRICWYEVEEATGDLMHMYTACARPAPLSPKVVAPGEMPFLSQQLSRHEVAAVGRLQDFPPEGRQDQQFLAELGVKSLLLIPASYSARREGVLGVSSYTKEVSWPEDTSDQLAIAANMMGAALERKYAELASQESEERFRSLFAQAPIGIALETIDGRILEVNPAFCAMIGYTAAELLTSSCARLSHPDDEAVEMAFFEELRQGLRSSYRMEKRFFRKDGSQMWAQISVSLLSRNQDATPLVIGMVSDITAQKNAESALVQRDQELQRLAGQLIEAQEEERRRISRELHDDIGQRLALLASELDHETALPSRSPQGREEELLRKVRSELDSIASDIHELSHELHSASLQYCGLRVALKDLCWKFSNNHHLEIEFEADKIDGSLSPDAGLCLFRVAQEALANALKHGRTKKVRVQLAQDSEKVRLTVKDFGVGFDPQAHYSGIGLMSMRERLRFSGGVLTVNSAPNQGTEITAEVAPVKKLVATANG